MSIKVVYTLQGLRLVGDCPKCKALGSFGESKFFPKMMPFFPKEELCFKCQYCNYTHSIPCADAEDVVDPGPPPFTTENECL